MKKIIAADTGADDSTYPALHFERLFGLTDIGRWWVMPDGLSMKEMEDYLWADGTLELRDDCDLVTVFNESMAFEYPAVAERFFRTQKLADYLVALNPDLAIVRFDPNNWGQLRGFVHGIVSGFNEDDLQGWIDEDLDRKGVEELRDLILAQYHLPAEESWYPKNLRTKFNQSSSPHVHLEIPCMFWAASARTVERINQQLQDKKPQNLQGGITKNTKACAPE